MRLSTPCSRIRSSGGETSLFFFSSSLAKTRVVASMAEAAIKMPPALMNFLRVAAALVFIDFSELRVAARDMPEFHDFDGTFVQLHSIVNEVRIAAKASNVLTLSVRGSELREVSEQLRALDQVERKCCRGGRIVRCDVAHDVFEPRDRGRREDYFVSHWPTISRTRATGTPRPASSSSAARSRAASKAASSLSDIRISSCEPNQAASADRSFGGNLTIAS